MDYIDTNDHDHYFNEMFSQSSLGFLFGLILPFIIYRGLPFADAVNLVNYQNYCNYSGFLYTGSTRRDALLFAADTYSPGLELAIKTLRSTGCQARIIIFASPNFRLPSRANFILKQMDIEMVNNCTETKGRPYVPHMLRFEYELEWLKKHISEVDRVFHSDAFDVLFQKDPFSNDISKDSLLFIVEPHCIRSCGWNLAWTLDCYHDEGVKWMRDHYIICSGSIIGGSNPYLALLELMVSNDAWKECYSPSHDQPILNYLVWSGTLSEHGIKYDITGCDGNFITMQWCVKDFHIDLNENGQIESIEKTVPAFVHQYNRYEWLTAKWYSRCHIDPYPIMHNHNS